MTITIIKRGTDPREQPINTTCSRCKTEFSFHEADAKRVTDQRDGDYFDLPCPVCGKSCTVSLQIANSHR
jgi:uncharacterized protein with PIN domain